MKILKKILIIVAVLVLAIVVVSQALPSTYQAERSIVISAKSEAIFPWISTMKKWQDWTPWSVAKDPTLVYSYEGPESGEGAISKWESKTFGAGSMKVTVADPVQGIRFDLAFEQGKYTAQGRFIFTAVPEGTKVTWRMEGNVSRNPLDRIFSVFMDKMVGPDFEEGLGNLKKKVEGK